MSIKPIRSKEKVLMMNFVLDCKNQIPPTLLMNVVADWIIEQPNFCAVKIPRVFLELPSIHKYVILPQDSAFKLWPLFAFVEWCLLEPLVSKNNSSVVYSMLHYGFLNYMSMQKKVQTVLTENSDDLEPGELLEENDGIELLSQSDVIYLVGKLQQMLDDCSGTVPSLYLKSDKKK